MHSRLGTEEAQRSHCPGCEFLKHQKDHDVGAQDRVDSLVILWKFPKTRGTFLGSPYNKDYSSLGSILGSPCFGKLLYEGIELNMNSIGRSTAAPILAWK